MKKEIEHYWNKFSERFYFEDGTCEELIDKDYFIAAMMEFSTNLSMKIEKILLQEYNVTPLFDLITELKQE